MSKPTSAPRRNFLRHIGGAAATATLAQFAPAAFASIGGPASLASQPGARSLAFDHTHTGERLSLVYAVGDQYVPGALGTLNRFLRDHYSGEIGQIDPQLFELLHGVQHALGSTASFQVISGYRCPKTNARLRNTRGGGVAKRSLHMDGKAIDVRIAGVQLDDLRDAAVSLNGGGVGFYSRDQFVHIDTGRVRTWG